MTRILDIVFGRAGHQRPVDARQLADIGLDFAATDAVDPRALAPARALKSRVGLGLGPAAEFTV